MSNKTFLVMAGATIVALLVWLAIQKVEDCAEQGGKACPLFGLSKVPKVPTRFSD